MFVDGFLFDLMHSVLYYIFVWSYGTCDRVVHVVRMVRMWWVWWVWWMWWVWWDQGWSVRGREVTIGINCGYNYSMLCVCYFEKVPVTQITSTYGLHTYITDWYHLWSMTYMTYGPYGPYGPPQFSIWNRLNHLNHLNQNISKVFKKNGRHIQSIKLLGQDDGP